MCNTYGKILNEILSQIPPPFKPSGTDNKDCFTKTCDAIYNVAMRRGYPFVSTSGEVLLYIGNHWVVVDSHDLKVFLKYGFKNVHNNELLSSQYSVVEGMFKQFPYTCLTPNTNRRQGRVNFTNGELDLCAQEPKLFPHDHLSYFRYVLPYDYDPKATAPTFHRYLDRVLPDVSSQYVLSEYLAWILYPSLKLEKMAFLYGSGCNGKSVFTEITEALFGSENVSHESLSDMCGESGDRSRSNLAGKLLNICSDVSPNACNGDIFKRIASNEPISAKLLYKDAVIIRDYAKMLFCLNELPKTNDLSNGYFRRFLIIPFNVQIPKSEIDPMLAKKIISTELPGIMNWVLQGRERLIKNGDFTHSQLCEDALTEYKDRMTGKKKPVSRIILPPYL